MSKVVTSLYGGLGNQLFQYAIARALAVKSNADVVLDLSWFKQDHQRTNTTPRNYALAPFNLPVQIQTLPLPVESGGRWDWLYKTLLQRPSAPETLRIYKERSYRFDARALKQSPPVCLDGYWQSPKYFDGIGDLLKAEIGTARALSNESNTLYQEIMSTEAVCLHVRRGDYVSSSSASQFHGLCSLDYYKRGVELVSAGLASPHGYVFSDDPTWVRENLRVGIDFTVVDVNGPDDAHQDLWLMAACKHFVIANSSLSWWGAWLGLDVHKKVIAPQRWFQNASVDVSDLFPGDWTRI